MALAIPPWKYAWSPGLWLPPAVQPEDGQDAGTMQSRKSTGSQRAARPGLAALLAAWQPTHQPKFPFKITETISVSLLTENPQLLFNNTVNVLKCVF